MKYAFMRKDKLPQPEKYYRTPSPIEESGVKREVTNQPSKIKVTKEDKLRNSTSTPMLKIQKSSVFPRVRFSSILCRA